MGAANGPNLVSSPQPWRNPCMTQPRHSKRGRRMGGFVLDSYDPGDFYCEMLRCPATAEIRDRLGRMPIAEFKRRAAGVEEALYRLGITFTVYTDSQAIDRILPFDTIPRVLPAEEWTQIERGVTQRVAAINLLLADLYNGQKVLKDGIVPAELILGNPNCPPPMRA